LCEHALDKLLKAKHISAKKAVKKTNYNIAKQFTMEYILGILNSSLINWYFLNFQSEGLHFYPDDAKKLPIANVDPPKQRKICDLVDKILAAKSVDPNADTTALERQIDSLVYRLYNLTYDEVKVIEPEFPLGKAEYEKGEESRNVLK
jgi:hypothetical protein